MTYDYDWLKLAIHKHPKDKLFTLSDYPDRFPGTFYQDLSDAFEMNGIDNWKLLNDGMKGKLRTVEVEF